MQTAGELLLKHEARGLRFALGFRATFVAVFLGIQLATAPSWLERGSAVTLSAGFAVILVWAYRALARGRGRGRIAWVAVGFDVFFLTVAPFTWWWSIGGAAQVPAAFLVKTFGLFPLCLTVLVMNSFVGRPALVAVATAGMVGAQTLFLGLAVADPRTTYSTGFGLHDAATINVVEWRIEVIVLIALGSGLALFTRSFRGTIHEAVRLEGFNQQVSRYFSPAVFETLARSEEAFFAPDVGTTQEVAILFCDLRGFTALSQHLAPNEVVRLLNTYHTRMVAALFAHGATLDKFLGDGILATFGTPRPAPDDCARAVRAAVAMSASFGEWNAERTRAGLSPLRQGIGLHFGPVVAGNIGTAERLEFTVIGDAVNVAARIEALTKELGEEVLFSEAVRERLAGDVATEAVGEFPLRGKDTPVRLHRPGARVGG